MNLASVHSDRELDSAFANTRRQTILLIEDIDATGSTSTREAITQNAIPHGYPAPTDPQESVSLSGLLNAIDGVASPDGLILFMTTNHVERLDPAMIRPGRVDIQEYVGLSSPAEARRMFLCFHPGMDDLAKVFADSVLEPVAAARIQGHLIAHRDPAEAVRLAGHLAGKGLT